jgi:signal transduction histidine kinase
MTAKASVSDRLNAIRRFLPLNRAIVALLALALVLLLAVNIATYVMVRRTAAYNDVVAHSKYTQLAGWELISLLTDAETGQRGYMLTAQPSYLAVYTNALERLPGVMDRMDILVEGNPDLEHRAQRIRSLYAERRALMVETIELTRLGRIGEAVSLVRSGRGKALMDGMRNEVAEIGAYEEARLASLTQNSEQAQSYTLAFNVLGALLVLVLGLISALLVRRQVSTLMAAQKQLDMVNAGLEEEVRERTSDLVRANEEIQRFAYIVSHDLRAPLVNVMGYTSELEQVGLALDTHLKTVEEKQPDLLDEETVRAVREDVPEAVGFIRASTAKMDGLIKAILQLSREGRRPLTAEDLNMTEVVQGLIDAVAHPIMESGGEASVEDLPRIASDRLSIEQIFGNLIDNAAKYQHPERPLQLIVKGREVEGGWVEFEISDNGRGVAAKDHERIFELFRRSGKQDKPGEGLGLAFVRSAVRRLGGSIRLDSDLGEGATFILRFPRQLNVRAE